MDKSCHKLEEEPITPALDPLPSLTNYLSLIEKLVKIEYKIQ